MKIIIIGAGFTGAQLAKRLINGKNDVVLIDNNDVIVRHASNRLDCDVVLADGNNLQTLEDAGIAEADALVCVTSSDEVNMITCSLVDSVYPDVLKIARVRNYAYYVNSTDAAKKHTTGKNHRPLYGIDYMIHPDVTAAEAIYSAVEHGAITDSMSFENSPYELIRITVEPKSKFDGIKLMDIRKTTEKPFLVSYVESDGKTSLPSGSTVLQAGDSLGILMEKANLHEFLDLCGSKVKIVKKIAIVGAGRIGTILLERFLSKRKKFTSKLVSKFTDLFSKISGTSFAIIDNNEEAAKAAKEKFPDVKVFQADISEDTFIEEEKINEYDLIIYTTSNHELNIVMAAYLESLGVVNSISLVSSSAYGNIARKIGIEVAVPMRDTVIDEIMSHLRGSAVTGIHSVNGDMEIVEITIPSESPVCGKMLKEIAENGKFLILMGHNQTEKSFHILTGNSMLNAGDKIVVITNSKDNEHVLKKFS